MQKVSQNCDFYSNKISQFLSHDVETEFLEISQIFLVVKGQELMSPVSPIFHIVSTVSSWSQTCS